MRTLRYSLTAVFFLISFTATSEAQFLGQQTLSQSSYVIDQTGNLWVWGRNRFGQLGIGDWVDRDTPVMVPIPSGASKWVLVAAGPNFAVAVADSDKLYAWGLNDKGQIGIGVAGGLYAVPQRIPNPLQTSTWKWVSSGADHCEALTTDGRLFAWGNNGQGQLGVGNEEYYITPQPVEFPTGVTSWNAVAAGPGYTMMLSQSGLLYGCGEDSLSTFMPLEAPQIAQIDAFRSVSPLPCLAASYSLESRISENRDVPGPYYTGIRLLWISPTHGNLDSIAAVADGAHHALVLSMLGRLGASGDNTYGQLGISGTNIKEAIVPFPSGVTQFVAIAAGLNHSLAIGNDGWLYAWGDNSVGELGIGNAINPSRPTRVLQVCPTIAMTANFSAPKILNGTATISLHVHATATSPTLTNTNAFLVLTSPLTYSDSMPDKPYGPQILPKDSGAFSWNISHHYNGILDTPKYFAYIRAQGSAPLLVYGTMGVPPDPLTIRATVLTTVEDSITRKPLSGVRYGPSSGDTTDRNGLFAELTWLDGWFACELVKENYNSFGTSYQELQQLDVETFLMGPSNVQGTFAAPAPIFAEDSIVKVYYPDSLEGFAISRRAIFRTVDSGLHWNALYIANDDLHDLKFFDPAHGWAVGDAGTVLNTTDSGATWESTRVGARNLRGISIIDLDTAWAVGDSGTLLKKSGDAWTALPALGKDNLSAIHFSDATHGAIVARDTYDYYLYNGSRWTLQSFGRNQPPPDLLTVYYVNPQLYFMAGTGGRIYPQSSFTTETIHSLYFLNPAIGFAMADSGASSVTYDGGASWAPMPEVPSNGTSINFFSLAGHGVSDQGVLNYDGKPSVVNSIVRGRITYGNPPEPIMGARVDRYYVVDTASLFIDSAYTNEQGHFVFSGIDGVFPYEYRMSFTDSGIAKSKVFSGIKGKLHEIITLDYNDYAPPPPPDTTQASVNGSSEAALSLEVSSALSYAHLFYSIPSAGTAKLILQDVLGRTVQTISDGFSIAGPQEREISLNGLPAGSYYITLETGAGSLTRKFSVLR